MRPSYLLVLILSVDPLLMWMGFPSRGSDGGGGGGSGGRGDFLSWKIKWQLQDDVTLKRSEKTLPEAFHSKVAL